MSADKDAETGREDLKAKFKEALDRKQGNRGGVQSTGHEHGKAPETHGPIGGKREFRRKSG